MKKLLYGLGALLLLILIAGIILTQVVDTERVKRVLIEQTKEKTGRTLVINGDLSWRFFPSIGFTVTDTALLNPPGFEGGNTLSIGELSLDVALRPLFNNRLDIGEAVLNNARLHLITRADGVTNLDDLHALVVEKPSPNASPKDANTDSPSTAGSKEPMSFSLAGVNVQDAEVVLDNQASAKLMRLTKVNIKLDDFAPGQTVPLSVSGNLFSDDIQGNINVDGQFWLAPEFNRLLLSDLKLEAGATGRAIPGNKQLQLQGQLAYDLAQKLAKFDEVALTLGELKVTGKLDVQHLKVPTLGFNLHTPSLNLDVLQEEWRSVSKPSKGLVKDRVKDKVKDKVKGSPAQLSANNADTATAHPQENAAATPGTLAKSTPASEANVSFLQDMDLKGDLSVDKLIVQGIELEQLDVHIQSKQGLLELKPIKARLYDGQMQGDAKLDFSAAPTPFSLHQVLTGVNAKPLLSAASRIDYLQGRADLTVDVTGLGFGSADVQKNLSGTARIQVLEGAVEGVDMAALIRRAHAKVKGLPVPAKAEVEKTNFDALTADFVVNKGVVSTDNLKLASPLLRIDGKGNTRLADESLDILLNTAVVGSVKGEDGEELKELDELKDVILPVRISGTYKEPQYRLELQQVLDLYLGDKADKELERLKRKLDGELGDKLNKKLGDKLPGLLDKLGL